MLKEEFKISYNEEYQSLKKQINDSIEIANDKLYAIKISLSMVGLKTSFEQSSSLNKEINKLYEHNYKLGISIEETINYIPQLIKDHKNKKLTVDSRVINKPIYKRIFGIPYAVEKMEFSAPIEFVSNFEMLWYVRDMATELGKMRASIDITNELKQRYKLALNKQDSICAALDIDSQLLGKIKHAISVDDFDTVIISLKSLFASMPYDMKTTEAYFHSHIHLILKLLGVEVVSEVQTNIGRIDSVIETEEFIHKKDDSTVAIEQILNKKYFEKYLYSKKNIILVGIAFCNKEKNLTTFEKVEYS